MTNIYRYISVIICSFSILVLSAQNPADKVWSGDVNNNGIVNHLDLLYLGAVHGFEANPRDNLGDDWMSNDVTIEPWSNYTQEAFTSVNCDTCTLICTDVYMDDIVNYNVYVDDVIYNGIYDSCNSDTTIRYTYFTLVGQGNDGPYLLNSWEVDGVFFSNFTFSDMDTLVEYMNSQFPSDNWILDTNSQVIIAESPQANNYGSLEVEHLASSTIATLASSTSIREHTSLCVSPGIHTVKLEPLSYECTGLLYDVNIGCQDPNQLWAGFDIVIDGDGNHILESWVTGGSAPYTLVWQDGVTTTTNDLSALSPGNYNYCLTVTDANLLAFEYCRNFSIGLVDSCFVNFYPAFADCNGSGLVEDSDLLSIEENYGQTHSTIYLDSFNVGTQGLDPSARLIPVGGINEFETGQTYGIELELGEMNNPIDFFYGISFTIEFDSICSPVIPIGGNIFTTNPAWIDDESDGLLFYEKWNGSNELKVTIVRKNQRSKWGFGDIGLLDIVIEDDVPTVIGGQPIMRIKEIRQVDEYLNEYPIVENLLIMDVLSPNNEIRTTSIQISPNPVTSRFIYINGLKNNEFKDISLYNVLGQEIPFTFTGNKISLQNKYTGFAFLEIKTQEGSMTEKLIIR